MRRALVALLLLSACSSPVETPPTEVLVTIDATSSVRAHTSSLTVLVSSSTTRDGVYGDTTSHGFGPPAAQVGFPRRLALVPRDGDASRFFEVEAKALALDPGTMTMTPIATTLVRSGYLPHRLLQLTIVLDDRPCPSPCAAGQTCRHGVCSAIFIDPGLLPDADAGVDAGPRSDGGDAGTVDGGDASIPDGGDAGGDAGCGRDEECDDGDACDGHEQCLEGVCQPGMPLVCDDHVGCTTNGCDPTDGCRYMPLDSLCTAGPSPHCDAALDCQYATCTASSCVPDASMCMNAMCVDTTCMHVPACTAGMDCCGGRCIPGCDDHNPCTDDSCEPIGHVCVHTNNMVACSDGNACTTADKCRMGSCFGGGPPSCDDGDTCTFDQCVSPGGCTHMHLAAGIHCDDGNFCTNPDVCDAAGHCVGTPAGSCDDSNPCTIDACDSTGGCTFTPGNDGAFCSDLSNCITSGMCSGGTCASPLGPCDGALGICCPSTGICDPGGPPFMVCG